MREDEHQPEKREELKPTVLPAREAMSLISPDPGAPDVRSDTGQDDEAGAEEKSGNDDSDENPGATLE